MALTEEDVRAALRDVYDPELPVNIVDLGLVYRVEVAPDHNAPGAGIPGVPQRYSVDIDVTLTSQGCPAHELILEKIRNRLAGVQAISTASVKLVWEPTWGPQRISTEARKHLGIE